MRAIKRILFVGLVIIILFSVFMINGLIEDVVVRNKINDFKARGVYIATVGNTSYFAVKALEDEDVSTRVVDYFGDGNIGYKGDIFVTSRNPVSGSALIGWLSDKTWIGHSGLVYDEAGEKTIEITGMQLPKYNVVRVYDNTWGDDIPETPQVALLRIKGITNEQRDKVIEYADSQKGKPYNFTFLLNRVNSYYCSDFVSRAIAYAGINVNYDYLATTGSDMIVSPNTYLVYYKEAISTDEGLKYEVYYLVE